MKIIQLGDVHLSSKITNNFISKVQEDRRIEVLKTFERVIDYAKSEDIHDILIPGDLFDTNSPRQRDVDFFLALVRNNKDINFYYLRGNHDSNVKFYETYDNLKLFSKDTLTSYKIADVYLHGVEISTNNYTSVYDLINLDASKFNILMLHGKLDCFNGVDIINSNALKDKAINYLVLGHIHQFYEGTILANDGHSFDYLNAGILEGRGYDERGSHGFYVIEIEDGLINKKEVVFASRNILRINVEVDKLTGSYDLINKLKEKLMEVSKNDIIQVVLVGNLRREVEFDLNYVKASFLDYYYLDIVSKYQIRVDYHNYLNDNTLKDVFIKKVLASDMSAEKKESVINLGLKVLEGGKK